MNSHDKTFIYYVSKLGWLKRETIQKLSSKDLENYLQQKLSSEQLRNLKFLVFKDFLMKYACQAQYLTEEQGNKLLWAKFQAIKNGDSLLQFSSLTTNILSKDFIQQVLKDLNTKEMFSEQNVEDFCATVLEPLEDPTTASKNTVLLDITTASKNTIKLGFIDEDLSQAISKKSKETNVFLELPENLGRYKIISEIGRGGMGRVYKAYDPELKREIALKTILGEQRKNLVKRFMREAETLARLSHPNIIKIYDVGTFNDYYYFTMDFVPGQNLCQLTGKIAEKKDQSLSFERIALIIYKAAIAIDYVHQHGVWHRDIKPANIMVNQNDEPIVMDFGLVKDKRAEQSLSKSGDILGTPAYMPPEQAKCKNLDKRIDVYSLGATLYYMLTKRPPFEGTNHWDILRQVFEAYPVRPRRLNPNIPIELEAICMKCLEKNPRGRYGNAQKLGDDLKNFLENRPIAAKSFSRFTYIKKWIKRNRAISIISTLGILAVIAGTVIALVSLKLGRDQALRAQAKTQHALKTLRLQKIETQQALALAENQKIESKLYATDAKLNEAKSLVVIGKNQVKNRNYIAAKTTIQKALLIVNQTHKILQATIFQKNTTKRYRNLNYQYVNLQRQLQDLYHLQIIPNYTPHTKIGFYENYKSMAHYPSSSWIPLTQQNRVIIWDVDKKKIIGHVYAKSPLNKVTAHGQLFTFWNTREIYLWPKPGKPSLNFQIPFQKSKTENIRHVRFNKNGQFLYIISNRRLVLWDIENNKIHQQWKNLGSNSVIFDIAPDNSVFAINSVRFTLLYQQQNKANKWLLKPIKRWEKSQTIVFRQDSKWLATGTSDKIILQNLSNQRKETISGHKGGVIHFAWSDNRRFFASLGKDHKVIIRDATVYKKIFTLPKQNHNAYAITFSDNDILQVWSPDSLRSYKLEPSLKAKFTKNTQYNKQAVSWVKHFDQLKIYVLQENYSQTLIRHTLIDIAHQQSIMALCWPGGILYIWDFKRDNLNVLNENKRVEEMRFSPNGLLLIARGGKKIEGWSIKTQQRVYSENLEGNGIVFHPQLPLVAMGSPQGIGVWQWNSNKLEHKKKYIFSMIQPQVISIGPKGKVMAAAKNTDVILWLFKTDNTSVLAKFKIRDVTALCFSNQKLLAIGNQNGHFIIWNWQKNKIVYQTLFDGSLEKIYFYNKYYVIVTTNGVYVDIGNSQKNNNAIYPLELYPGYFKGKVALSSNLRYLGLIATNLEILLFDFKSAFGHLNQSK